MKSDHNLSSLQKNTDAYCDVLYISECSAWGEDGYKTVSSAFHSALPIFWSPDMPKPDIDDWQGDWIISFKSDLVLPRSILERAKKGAINFHPCPPQYRGLGGYWWALHNGDDVFGVTCHHMDECIDHGDIIRTESFPIWQGETVESLKHRAALYSLGLLNSTLNDIMAGKPLLSSGEKWGQHLYTQKELTIAQAQAALKAVTKDDLAVPTIQRGRYSDVAQPTCGIAI